MRERIIVSMTSYPARIQNVPISIFALTKKQTLPPDEIHLWLSVPEFPRKEADLPKALVAMAAAGIVKIHWLPVNTYVHKRHQIFKIVKNSDLVFMFDDDVIYNSKLIAHVVAKHKEFPDFIINYNKYNESDVWCGQSMIPAYLYPMEALDDNYQNLLIEHNIKSDEVYLNRWIRHNHIKVYNELRFGWGTLINEHIGYHSGHAPRDKRAEWIKFLDEVLFK